MVARLKGRPSPPGPSKEEKESASVGGQTRRSPVLITLTVLSLVVAIAASATLIYMSYFAKGSLPASNSEAAQAQSTGPLYNLGPFVMNLGNIDEHRYLRVALSLDFQTRDSGFVGRGSNTQNLWREQMRETLKTREPILKDVVFNTLSSRSAQSVGTAIGREELKADLMARFNQQMPENLAVQQIYFTDFVIQ